MPSILDDLEDIDFKDEKSIEKVMKAISERRKEWFQKGFSGIEVTERIQIMSTVQDRGLLLISPKAVDIKLGGQSIRWRPIQELLQAFRKLKEGKELIISEEAAIQALWHEILHFRAEKPFAIKPSKDDLLFMETLNEFVARHTYDELLKLFGARPKFKAEFVKNCIGYQLLVEKFTELNRYLRLKAEEIEKVLLSNYIALRMNFTKMVAEKYNLSEGQRYQLYDIFNIILNRRVSLTNLKAK